MRISFPGRPIFIQFVPALAHDDLVARGVGCGACSEADAEALCGSDDVRFALFGVKQ